MDTVLAHLVNAHSEAKNVAIAAIQADQDTEQAITAIKAIHAVIQAIAAEQPAA